jgi:hypothetical protein
MVIHVQRDEFQNRFMNLILAGLSGFVAYGRGKLSPLVESKRT